MRIGVAATPEVAIPTLDWLINSGHHLSLVISTPQKPSGRGQVLKPSPAARWAHIHNIPLITPLKPDEMIDSLHDLDLVITIGYGVLLPESILAIPRQGFINLHFSLLPQYRGAAPVQRALQNGETVTGVTVFQLDKGMDTGPIYSQLKIQVDPQWRTSELLRELSHLGVLAIKEAISAIERGELPVPQSGVASYAPKITKQEALIDFNNSAQKVVQAIHAFTEEPGAWTTWKGQPFKISQARVEGEFTLSPGEIATHGSEVLVGCDKSVISISTVIPAGKKEMPASDWARGARLIGGEHFG